MPYNSSFNDVYYYVREGDKGVYFSSNRTGSAFIDKASEACCYDIYKAAKGKQDIILNALTFDAFSEEELKGAAVRVIDVETEKNVGYKINPVDNDHFFTIEKAKEYIIIGEKLGYASDTIQLSTVGVTEDTIIRKLYLEPNTKLDFSDITTLENIHGNDFNLQVKRNTKYRITVSKDGYESSSVILDTAGATGKITKKIYLRKQENLNLFLPLTLYFDNDSPDPKSVKSTTSFTYTQTYYPYVNKKDEFKSRYTKPLNGETKIIAEQELEQFFEADVKGGYQQLERFLDALHGRLTNGEKITLVMKGYASPVAKKKYNKILSNRRIHSVKNELKKYKSGMFTEFINSGSLSIREIPYGEELAPVNISDSQRDRRKSVYSPEASRERRTEILKVETTR